MTRPHAILGIVLSATVIPAQRYHSSPGEFLTTEGSAASSSFGAYPAARHMFFDGELRGIRGSIKEVAFRLDYRVHAAQLEVGRSWTKVTLDISGCDLGKLSRTFSRNPTSTPARVFGAPLRWPRLSGFPLVQPAPWGTLFGSLRLPFNRPWSYAGQGDVCLDFNFTGGVLDNKGAWPANTAREYHLDGFTIPTNQNVARSTSHGKSLSAGGCIDSKAVHGLGGYTAITATTYGLVSPTHPGKFVLDVTALATANSQPAVHAVSLGGNILGTPFPGVTCNRLYLDLSKPTVFLTKVGPPPSALVHYQLGPFPYTAASATVPIWAQVAWNDAGGAGVKLTSASRVLVPKMPPAHLRSCLYQPVVQRKTSTGIGPSGATQLNPVCRYAM